MDMQEDSIIQRKVTNDEDEDGEGKEDEIETSLIDMNTPDKIAVRRTSLFGYSFK